MFVLKSANRVFNFTTKLNRIQWKSITQKIEISANIQQNKNKSYEKYIYTAIKSSFPYMKSEMEKHEEHMEVFLGKSYARFTKRLH